MMRRGIYTVAKRRQFEPSGRLHCWRIPLIHWKSYTLAQHVLSTGTEHSSIPPLFTPGVSRGFFWGRNNNTMNIKGSFKFLGAGALCLALGACMSNTSNSEIGAVTGAVVGGLAGAALTGNFAGAIAGLAIGGAAGYEIGKNK